MPIWFGYCTPTTSYCGWVKRHQNMPLVTGLLPTTTTTRWSPAHGCKFALLQHFQVEK
ncbi:hypothetical protein HanPSC8_Chr04g0179801 [Helianthus annuus]|nr:hypothetical protein HanPSC8_Chr04g0179801 [Helianthus annuus]